MSKYQIGIYLLLYLRNQTVQIFKCARVSQFCGRSLTKMTWSKLLWNLKNLHKKMKLDLDFFCKTNSTWHILYSWLKMCRYRTNNISLFYRWMSDDDMVLVFSNFQANRKNKRLFTLFFTNSLLIGFLDRHPMAISRFHKRHLSTFCERKRLLPQFTVFTVIYRNPNFGQKFPQVTTGYYGLPRVTTGYHGLPRVTTGYHGLPQVNTG